MTSSVEAFKLPHGDHWQLSYFRAWFEFHAKNSNWHKTTNPMGIDIVGSNSNNNPFTLHALPGDWIVKNGDGWEVRTDAQWGRWGRQDGEEEKE